MPASDRRGHRRGFVLDELSTVVRRSLVRLRAWRWHEAPLVMDYFGWQRNAEGGRRWPAPDQAYPDQRADEA